MAGKLKISSNAVMQPNARFENFKVEVLDVDPDPSTAEVGRIWFNSAEKAFKSVQLDDNGVNIVAGLGNNSSGVKLGEAADASWQDGLFYYNGDTYITKAVDDFNEALADLAPEPAPFLSGTLSSTATVVTGIAADGSGLNGVTAGTTYYNVTKSTSADFTTPNLFGPCDTGVVAIEVNGEATDSIDLAASFDESLRISGTQSFTEGALQVYDVSKYNNFRIYQAGYAKIVGADLNLGENSFKIKHTFGDFVKETGTKVLISDPDSNVVATFDTKSFDIVEDSATFTYLSGVKYCDTNTKFKLSFQISDLFKNFYENDPVYASFSGGTNKTFSVSDLGITGTPSVDDTVNVTDYEFTFTTYNTYTESVYVSLTARKPFGDSYSGNIYSATTPMLYTRNDSSTDLVEYFYDEQYRLPIADYNEIPDSIKDVWDSTLELGADDLQVSAKDRLVVADTAFTDGKFPSQDVTYSDRTAGTYIRAFSDSEAKSNGQIFIDGVTTSNLNAEDVKVYIKLPTQTGWLDMNKAFDDAVGVENDGDGCKVGDATTYGSGVKLDWTGGGKSTANAGYMAIVKVVINDSTINVTKLQMNNW